MRHESFAEGDLSCNDFLGGRVRLWQPRAGYRAGIDPVLLAASVRAKPGHSLLELGCGAAPALLCLNARVPGLRLTGVEVQAGYADLARRNAALNGADIDVVTADLDALPVSLRRADFDHVLANPPYFEPARRTAAADPGREHGLAETLPLARWVAVAAKRVKPGGTVTMIQRAARLAELLAGFEAGLGSIQVLPLAPRAGRDAKLVILRGRKGGRAALRLHPPLILHDGARHDHDAEDYAPAIAAVLRQGAALPFPD